MMDVFAPRRRRGVEMLDDPGADPQLVVRSLEDVAVANRLFGGSRAVVRELMRVVPDSSTPAVITLLDVGTGLGDIPVAAGSAARDRGVTLVAFGVDASEASLQARRDRALPAIRADALALPFQDGAFDVVVCSQLLHHFADADAFNLLRELNRVARLRVIVSDIRRSWFAAAGIWLASFPLRFHPVSRRDGVTSVLRGFTTSELDTLIRSAFRTTPRVAARLGFRVTASWIPVQETHSA